jgi:predicted nucleic acid-binding protein
VAVVSNSSPRIAFAAIEQLHLFSALFDSVLIPSAVAREIAPSISTLPPWLRVQDVRTPLPQAVMRRSLGDGEREALALAVEIQAERILLDDRAARRVAQELHLLVTGTAGILLVAKRHVLLPRIRPVLDALLRTSFFLSQQLYNELLQAAGEIDSNNKR